MATISAVPRGMTGVVALYVDLGGSDTLYRIYRADSNGTREVRLRAGILPAGQGGQLALEDHEAALSGPIEYRLHTAFQSTATASLRHGLGTGLDRLLLPRFSIPTHPQFSVEVETVTAFSGARRSRSTVHRGINRATPLVALGRLEPRTGTLEVVFDTPAQARELEALFEYGHTVMYRQAEHPGMDLYFIAETVELVPDDDGGWIFTIAYVETGPPSGDVAPGNWTFNNLRDSLGSFTNTAIEFPSFDDLAAGPIGGRL